MAGANQFTNYPAQFQGGSTWNLAQLGTGNYDAGLTIDEVIPSGLHRRDAVIVAAQMPVLSFDTTDLTSVLTNITDITTGFDCTSGGEFYYKQRTAGGLFEGAGAHLKHEAFKGHLILDSISASGSSPAQANLTFHELYDGTNALSVPTAASSLGATTPAFVSQFYRGAVTLNGTAIDNVMDVSVSFGLSVSKEIYSGDTSPRTLSVVTVVPVITVTVADLAEWPSKTTNSYGVTFATLVVYFRKGADGGLRGGAGTALSVTATEGHVHAREIRGGGTGNSSLSLEFRPTADLSFSLGATHP